MSNLGRMYEHGKGVEQNDRKVCDLYIKAISLGNISMYNINYFINKKNISINDENKILNIHIKNDDLYRLQSKIIVSKLNSVNNIEKEIEYISTLIKICVTYDKIKIINNIYENEKIKIHKSSKILIRSKLLEIMRKEESMKIVPNDILHIITLFYI